MLRSAIAQTLPPRPPSPPSGPPFGMNFSRRNDALPSPPFPAATSMVASSTNFTMGTPKRKSPAASGRAFHACVCRGRSGARFGDGLDTDDAAVQRALDVELDLAGGQREQCVVAPNADVVARMELGPALANDDLTRLDALAAVHLHAEALGLGVAAVSGRSACFLVCHLRS